MKYKFSKAVKDNDVLRASFNALTRKTFGFDFEDWYASGHWGQWYIPHVLLDGDKVISNVSVNLMQFDMQGVKKNYIQLGTVMTDEAYRGQGLNREIMERILEEYADKADGIYLFGNDDVLEYYPRFGFRSSKEYEYYMPCKLREDMNAESTRCAGAEPGGDTEGARCAGAEPGGDAESVRCAGAESGGDAEGTRCAGAEPGGDTESAKRADRGLQAPYIIEKIDMTCPQQAEKLYDVIRNAAGVLEAPEKDGLDDLHGKNASSCDCRLLNPNDGMYMNENLSLYQFWLAAGFGEHVYYLSEIGVYVIAERDGEILRVHQMFGQAQVDMIRLAETFTEAMKEQAGGIGGDEGELPGSFGGHIKELVLGYTPVHKEDFSVREHKEEDCTLFILGDELSCIEREKLLFPVMSHA